MSAVSSRSAFPSAHTGLDRVFADITAEREAQFAIWGVQHHLPDGTGAQWTIPAEAARRECEQAAATGNLAWRHILSEEVAEALVEDDPVRLRAELIQVAAVVVQWIQAIDHRGQSATPEETSHGSGRSSATKMRTTYVAARQDLLTEAAMMETPALTDQSRHTESRNGGSAGSMAQQHNHDEIGKPPGESMPTLAPLCGEVEFTELMAEMVADEAPRLFAVVQEYGERIDGRIAAWGMAFDNHAEIVGVDSSAIMRLRSPERAARHLSRRPNVSARVVWVNPDTATSPDEIDASEGVDAPDGGAGCSV